MCNKVKDKLLQLEKEKEDEKDRGEDKSTKEANVKNRQNKACVT